MARILLAVGDFGGRAVLRLAGEQVASLFDEAATAMIDRLIHHAEILSLQATATACAARDLDARIGAKPVEIA